MDKTNLLLLTISSVVIIFTAFRYFLIVRKSKVATNLKEALLPTFFLGAIPLINIVLLFFHKMDTVS